ncbi:hypothetical protein JCM31826_15180 [Thermaurantimonas aggregans]|uniref:Lipoprotein n=1 Tax=Thermaurantimonas aggregans TaxID=2173829 RepID=A0A401XM07_9FLAO|nr:hypothetical protein [Thermaurantimonas aggregans]MCX8148047.1 hypothetical protein [Thermaurantimonas aggregans]GCD78036.1 hypothetical protein JCM31826_15180 [Thermaurantimonas aggregans]
MKKVYAFLLTLTAVACVKYRNDFNLSVHFLDSFVYTSGIFDSLKLNLVKIENLEPEGTLNCTYQFKIKIDPQHQAELQKLQLYFFDLDFQEDRAGGLYYRFNDIARADTLVFKHRSMPCNGKVRYFYRVYARSVADGNLVFISNPRPFEYN